jgi:hypothetical protein
VQFLAPLVDGSAANLRWQAGLPDEVPVNFVVVRPDDDPDTVGWTGDLAPFVTTSTLSRPAGTEVFPSLASADDVPLLVGRQVFEACVACCRDDLVEQGGVLLGTLHRAQNGAGQRLWAEVLACAPALGAASDAAHVTFTSEAWRAIFAFKAAKERQLGLDRPLQTLGWVHGHLNHLEGDVPLFLSAQDLETMAQHFPEPFACAIVVDAQAPIGAPPEEHLACFGWDSYGISVIARSLQIPTVMGERSGAGQFTAAAGRII